MYIALKGDQMDGHSFIETAARNGAGCVLIEKRGMDAAGQLGLLDRRPAVVMVPDTLAALGELARRHRKKLAAKIVAITGSNGKTSAKEFVSAILSSTYRTVWAPRSFNNAIGVPLTLLRMTETTHAGVLEIGMNHPGEIADLCRIADPDVVAITSILPAHIGFFKSIRAIAAAKSEILTASRKGIPAFLPVDSVYFPFLRRQASGKRVIPFGVRPEASLRLRDVDVSLGTISFSAAGLHSGESILTSRSAGSAGLREGTVSFRCPNFGEHQLTNILLAVGIGVLFAVPLKAMKKSVSQLNLPAGRGEVRRLGRHILIDDSYNANPGSMAASLLRISSLKRRLKSRLGALPSVVLVLGDMLELGSSARFYHHQLGKQIQASAPRRVLYIGVHSDWVKRGFVRAGGKAKNYIHSASIEEGLIWLNQWVRADGRLLILIKASHRLNFQKIVSELINRSVSKLNAISQ